MTYDIAILGGGPAGYVGALRAARLGLGTALIEKEQVGGTCLNWGCIPTKSLYASAALFEKLKRADEYGIRINGFELDFSRVMTRKSQIREKLVGGIRQLLQANKVDVFSGRGRVTAANKIRVNGIELTARHLLLATGSQTAALPIPGIDLPNVYDSRTILELDRLPASLAIIGGGVIGIEFASIFAAFGAKVTLIEMADSLLGGIDGEVVGRMEALLRQRGLDIHKSSRVLDIRSEARTGKLRLQLAGAGGATVAIETDAVLSAAGRAPDFGGVDLDKLGIRHDAKTGIAVDETMRTSADTIYAAGDVTGGPLLAHVASHEALLAVEHIAARLAGRSVGATAGRDPVIPACIFALPEIAVVGWTEQQARAKHADIVVSRFPYAASGKAQAEGEREGFVKLVARKADGRLLGAHMIGAHASEMIQEATLALQQGMSAADLAAVIHPHPTLSESVAEAALGVNGLMLHFADRSEGEKRR